MCSNNMEPNFNGTLDISVGEAVCSLKETLANRYYRLSITKMRLITSYVSLLTRLVVPVFVTLYYIFLRNQRLLFDGFRRHVVTTLLALLTKGVLFGPTNKIDPLLRTFRVVNFRPRQLFLNEQGEEVGSQNEPEPEKSVHCDVLYDPGVDNRVMDVIFIHGLKGSLERTWTQGMWDLKSRDHAGRVLLRKSLSTPIIKETTNHAEVHRNRSDSNLNKCCDLPEEGGVQCCEIEKEDIIDNNNTKPTVKSETVLKCDSEETTMSRCWPKDWLPKDCPGVRVIALNYTTDPYLWRLVWMTKRRRENEKFDFNPFVNRTSMSERAWEMIEHLVRLGVGEHPIVWVGHSKGGLFVKQMLVHACESNNPQFSRLCTSSGGILFYSVPHRGSPLANLNLPLLRQSIELTEVQKDSAEVLALHAKFRALLDNENLQIEVRSFIETTLTLMSLVYVRIVSVESADAEIGELYGVPIDHRNICKPRSRNCFLYKELVSLINAVSSSESRT